MTVQTFRKRPVEVEAVQFTGDNINELWDWAGADVIYGPTESDPCAYIETMEGRMRCAPGWWVIRGVASEYYPCEPAIFEATYEATGGGEPANVDLARHELIAAVLGSLHAEYAYGGRETAGDSASLDFAQDQLDDALTAYVKAATGGAR